MIKNKKLEKIEKLRILKDYHELINKCELLKKSISDDLEEEIKVITENISNIKYRISRIVEHPNIKSVLRKIAFLYSDYISFDREVLVCKTNNVSEDYYDENNYYEVTLENVKVFETSVKSINNKDNIQNTLESLCKSFKTLTSIYLNLNDIESKLCLNVKLEKDKKINEIKKHIEEYETKYDFVKSIENINLLLQNQKVLNCVNKFEDLDYKERYVLPLGHIETVIPDDIKKFVREQYNYQLNNMTEEVKLTLSDGENSVFINIDEEPREEFYYNLFYKIIFNFLSEFKLTNVSVAMIEEDTKCFPLQAISKTLLDVNKSLIYTYEGQNKVLNVISERSHALDFLRNITQLYKDRLSEIINKECENIQEYNEKYKSYAMDYLLILVNKYEFIGKDRNLYEEFINLIKNTNMYKTGIMLVVLGKNCDYTYGYNSVNEKLDLKEYGIREINVKDDNLYIHDNVINTNYLSLTPFKNPEFKTIKEVMAKKTSHVFKRVNEEKIVRLKDIYNEKPEKHFSEMISIPIAKPDKVFNLQLSSNTTELLPFTFVSGMSGCGKTVFLNSVILGAAMKYSPDELQIYLLDFKSDGESLAFEEYKYIPNEENWYIPHIKYISTKCKPENAFGAFEYISYMQKERSLLGKYRDYNKNYEFKEGTLNKYPFALFIIDEASAMFNQLANNSEKKELERKMINVLNLVRDYGIGIIFSTQTPSEFSEEILASCNYRIGFYPKKDEDLSTLFPYASRKWFRKFPKQSLQVSDEASESVAGYTFFGKRTTSEPIFLRTAFASKDDMPEITKTIREKYKNYANSQIIIDKLDKVKLSTSNKYLTWEDYNKINEEDNNSANSKPLVIGFSERELLPVAIDFNKYYDRNNYFAYANSEVLKMIEQNSIIAYAYQMIHLGVRDKCITYCGSKESYDKIISVIRHKAPYIEKEYITHIENNIDIIKYLLNIDKNEEEDKYIIIHDLSWTEESELSKILDIYNKENSNKDDSMKVNVETSEKKIEVNEFLNRIDTNKDVWKNSKQQKRALELFAELSKNKNERMNELSSRNYKGAINKDLVYKTLTNIYMKKNIKGIFTLLCTEDYKYIERLLRRFLENNPGKEELLNNRALYGTYDMVSNHYQDTKQNENYCFSLSSKTNVRMIDYASSDDWFKELEKSYRSNKE